MKAVIHQPMYFPYPGFFHKLSMADVLVVMDRAQFSRGFINRNRILDTHGPQWLTVPIKKAQRLSPILDVEINNSLPWRDVHWRRLLFSYSNSDYFHLYRDYLEEVYSSDWTDLVSLNLETLRATMGWLGVNVRVIQESELNVSSKSTQRLVDICEQIGADTYVSGKGGRDYMDEALFASRGLGLVYAKYESIIYPQRFSSAFVPDLSIIDLVSNVSPADLKPIISGETATAAVA